ncbi:hypothetical protein BDZ91DRAFT_807823 [Kalaharituber pfeilii]|nr:hypothetical protein BDZ91DRAFT_807823 [Kalaharituber pfeilii]
MTQCSSSVRPMTDIAVDFAAKIGYSFSLGLSRAKAVVVLLLPGGLWLIASKHASKHGARAVGRPLRPPPSAVDTIAAALDSYRYRSRPRVSEPPAAAARSALDRSPQTALQLGVAASRQASTARYSVSSSTAGLTFAAFVYFADKVYGVSSLDVFC